MLVWVEDWEMRCCGDPFAIGFEVEWGLVPISPGDRAFLAAPLGERVGDELTHCELHHDSPADLVMTRGKVKSIMAAYWKVAPRPGENPNFLYPIPGTGVLEDRQSADGWEATRDGLEFEGYIVELVTPHHD